MGLALLALEMVLVLALSSYTDFGGYHFFVPIKWITARKGSPSSHVSYVILPSNPGHSVLRERVGAAPPGFSLGQQCGHLLFLNLRYSSPKIMFV